VFRILCGSFLSEVGVIGPVGLGETPVLGLQNSAYFIDPANRGQGYAAEAMWGFLQAFGPRFDFDEIETDHFNDNLASGVVLRKLGFKQS
jgi:RimJ/RimL family protein N-acetyltransferase